MSAKPDLPPLVTERCARSPIPGRLPLLAAIRAHRGTDRLSVCHWCGRTCDPVIDLGDPPCAGRRR